jgi:hypothetical protein
MLTCHSPNIFLILSLEVLLDPWILAASHFKRTVHLFASLGLALSTHQFFSRHHAIMFEAHTWGESVNVSATEDGTRYILNGMNWSGYKQDS